MGFFGQFFQGRNGVDQLNIALMGVAVALTFLGRFMFQSFFPLLAYVTMFLCMFRLISRNIPKRQAENAYFLNLIQGLRNRTPRSTAGAAGSRGPREKKDRANYRYFKCPNCKRPMRIPRGKGQVKVTCSQCGEVFYKQV